MLRGRKRGWATALRKRGLLLLLRGGAEEVDDWAQIMLILRWEGREAKGRKRRGAWRHVWAWLWWLLAQC